MFESDECGENSIHKISEDSDDISDTEKIIREKIKIFKYEEDAVRLLLTEHFRKFRFNFFSKVKMTHKSVYQAIKKEIRNCFNPYRIFIKDKKIENEKELKALYEELKRYYKEKNFNNTFFINYFKDLKNAHEKKSKSKFINMLPKNEEEALNDIHRKVMLIRTLKKYLVTTIVNRFQQINFDKNEEKSNKDEFIMMFQYLVIKRENFSCMNEEDLNKNISNIKGSNKLRRPINDFETYNYLPILCKGHCKHEAELFIHALDQEINQNHNICKECQNLKINFNNIKSQIRNLYSKTCVFSHNINEIMFHPLFFFSFENIPFYFSELNSKSLNANISNIIETNKIPFIYTNLKSYKLRKLYNENESSMKEIIKLIKDYSLKSNLFGGSCFLPDYKTKKCSIGLFKLDENDYMNHMLKCPYYHDKLERRRPIQIKKNIICSHALKEGGREWISDNKNISCKEEETCDKFHTRNELFFDERYFRKLYPCSEYLPEKDEEKYYYNFCKKFDMCPRKHPIDIKIDEIYLPFDYKMDLKRELKKLQNKNTYVEKKIKYLKKIECRYCLNYIDGKDGRYLVFFNNCNHIICSKCLNTCGFCPFCGLNSSSENIIIKISTKNNIKNESDDEIDNSDEEKENDEESGDDKDIENDGLFGFNNDENLNETYNSQKYNQNFKEDKNNFNNNKANYGVNNNHDNENSLGFNLGRIILRGNRRTNRGANEYRSDFDRGSRRARGRWRGRGRGRGYY